MSQEIPEFDSRRGRPPKYDWDRWTDGKSRRLYKGTVEEVTKGEKDFEANLISFRTMVHRKARDLGPHIGALTHIHKADQSIDVRFYDRTQESV
jgi:hypothetical protein